MKTKDTEILEKILRVSGQMRRHRGGCQCGTASPPGGTPPHFGLGRVLDALLDADGLTQCELASRLDLRPQSLSEALTKLSADGMVIRTGDSEDRRALRVKLTDEGRKRAEERRVHRESFASQMLSPLSEEEKEQLFALLSKITSGNDAESGDKDEKDGEH